MISESAGDRFAGHLAQSPESHDAGSRQRASTCLRIGSGNVGQTSAIRTRTASIVANARQLVTSHGRQCADTSESSVVTCCPVTSMGGWGAAFDSRRLHNHRLCHKVPTGDFLCRNPYQRRGLEPLLRYPLQGPLCHQTPRCDNQRAPNCSHSAANLPLWAAWKGPWPDP